MSALRSTKTPLRSPVATGFSICPVCYHLTDGWQTEYKTATLEVLKQRNHSCEFAPRKLKGE